MNTRLSKVLFGLVGAVLLGMLTFFYVGFNGNPIRVYLTRGQIARYLKTTYPDIKFTDISSHYNFKSSSYGGRATAHTDPVVDVYINQYKSGVFSDNLLQAKLTAQAKAEIFPLASSLFPGKKFMLMLGWDESKLQLPISTRYSKDLPLELFLDVRWQGGQLTEDGFIDEVLRMHQELKDEGYNFTGYTFIFEVESDKNSLMLTLKGGELNMTREALREQLYRYDK